MAYGQTGDRNILDAARIEQLCAHYQYTNEMVHRLWERRNHQFVTLTAVVALAAIVTLLEGGLAKVLINYLEYLKLLDGGGDGAVQRSAIKAAVSVIPAFLTVAVFYLMTNVYHRSVHITNYYRYIGRLEEEIRKAMSLMPTDWAFTREGSYFRRSGERVSRKIGSLYKWILLLLLVSFFSLRLIRDGLTAWSAVVSVTDPVFANAIGGDLWGALKPVWPFFMLAFDFVMIWLTLRVYGAYAKWWWVDEEALKEGYS